MKAVRRILLSTDAVGGVWTYSVELAHALVDHGVKAVLAVLGPPPSHGQRATAKNVEIVVTELPLDWTADSPAEVHRAARALARLADDHEADLVQLHSASLAAEGSFSKPVIAVQHSCIATWWRSVRSGPLPPEFGWQRDLVEAGLNAASAVVAPTTAFAAETMRTYRLHKPVDAVHNGRTPFALQSTKRSDAVLTVGRLWDEGKNVRTLDAAAAKLDVPVEAVGALSGPDGSAVRFDHLTTPGSLPLQALAGRLAARPIFVSAALYEPFGLSVLEAAQAGCALVLSDIPTFRELWDGAALFVPPSDAAALAAAIQHLIDDEQERDRLEQVAMTRAARFTPSAMALQMLAIHERVLGEQSPIEPVLEVAV